MMNSSYSAIQCICRRFVDEVDYPINTTIIATICCVAQTRTETFVGHDKNSPHGPCRRGTGSQKPHNKIHVRVNTHTWYLVYTYIMSTSWRRLFSPRRLHSSNIWDTRKLLVCRVLLSPPPPSRTCYSAIARPPSNPNRAFHRFELGSTYSEAKFLNNERFEHPLRLLICRVLLSHTHIPSHQNNKCYSTAQLSDPQQIRTKCLTSLGSTYSEANFEQRKVRASAEDPFQSLGWKQTLVRVNAMNDVR